MIPKIIHYCWFGGKELPQDAKACIATWYKSFPDYEIKRWDESNFDINKIPYIKEAYSVKKYAFVSDYARFWVLYNYGGIYFDVDVEVISPMDDILNEGAFMGCETDGLTPRGISVNPGLGVACEANNQCYADLLDLYSTFSFKNESGELNLKTVVEYTTEYLQVKGLENKKGIQRIAGINIYPAEYFNPIDADKNYNITNNSKSIHHFSGTWMPRSARCKNKILAPFRRNRAYRFLMDNFLKKVIDFVNGKF